MQVADIIVFTIALHARCQAIVSLPLAASFRHRQPHRLRRPHTDEDINVPLPRKAACLSDMLLSDTLRRTAALGTTMPIDGRFDISQ